MEAMSYITRAKASKKSAKTVAGGNIQSDGRVLMDLVEEVTRGWG